MVDIPIFQEFPGSKHGELRTPICFQFMTNKVGDKCALKACDDRDPSSRWFTRSTMGHFKYRSTTTRKLLPVSSKVDEISTNTLEAACQGNGRCGWCIRWQEKHAVAMTARYTQSCDGRSDARPQRLIPLHVSSWM